MTEDAIARMSADEETQQLAAALFTKSFQHRYSYNFEWMGRPIIQYPQDIVAMQEILWRVRPDLVIETGIAHGGSLVFYASMLELMGGSGSVLGIDVDIRPHNRAAIEAHSMAHRIQMIEGSSVDDAVMKRVRQIASGHGRVLVALDSNHTHAHVMRELQLYSPLVTEGSYLVVFDTVVEDLPAECFLDRPWGPGDNPKTAVREFLKHNDRFVIDRDIDRKLLMTVSPEGYLRCVKR